MGAFFLKPKTFSSIYPPPSLKSSPSSPSHENGARGGLKFEDLHKNLHFPGLYYFFTGYQAQIFGSFYQEGKKKKSNTRPFVYWTPLAFLSISLSLSFILFFSSSSSSSFLYPILSSPRRANPKDCYRNYSRRIDPFFFKTQQPAVTFSRPTSKSGYRLPEGLVPHQPSVSKFIPHLLRFNRRTFHHERRRTSRLHPLHPHSQCRYKAKR